MSLNQIEIKGYKSFRELDLELRSLNVLIGANGAGKSNFIILFEMLNEMAMGNLQTYVSTAGGADTFLHFGQKNTDRIYIKLTFDQNAYECTWLPTVEDSLVFGAETVYYQGQGYERPWSDSLGQGHSESRLSVKAAEPTNRVARYVLNHLQSWRVYHFHDTSNSAPVKKVRDLNDNLYLRSDASNLAAFLFHLQATATDHYTAIRDTVRMVAPFFDDFFLRPQTRNKDKIRLEWRQKGSDYPFLAHHLSDGTLRFIGLATLLLQPEPPSTILIDEPELGLHPYAINVLASLMRSAATRTQLIVSTQSVPLVNQFAPEDLLVADFLERATTITRPDPKKLTEWLEDYSLGDLWEKNVLGGRPAEW